jgi:hypothetical protein
MNRDKGYNLMHGGYPGRLCEESKKLMQINSAGKLKGYKHTQQAIDNMRKAQQNRSDEWKKKNAEALVGRVISEKTREKIRQARVGQTISEETRQKLSAAMKGKKKSKEHVEKVILAKKNWMQTEAGIAWRKWKSEQMKHREISAETRAKISIASKNRKKKNQPETELFEDDPIL